MANYWLGSYQDTVWIIGDGRSGTTWVSDLINHYTKYREMFEPFHPSLVDRTSFLLPNQYIRPNDPNIRFQRVASSVFSGRFLHHRVDNANSGLLYRGLLIKDIFANLFASWISHRYPKVKILLLIRNPFAVALSKYGKRDWIWMTNPTDFLKQSELYDDYLRSFEDLIRTIGEGNDYIQRQILIWSILHHVPLLQFQPNQIHIVFYEDMVSNPNHEMLKILDYIRPDHSWPQIDVPQAIIYRPSRVTNRVSNDFADASRINSWKKELSPGQIDAGLKILSHFGFENLYDDDSMPNKELIGRILEKL